MTVHDEDCEADWGPEGQESPCRCGISGDREEAIIHFIGEEEITECGETKNPIVSLLEYPVTCPECIKSLENK